MQKRKGATQKAQETDSAYPADHCHDTDPDRIPFLIRAAVHAVVNKFTGPTVTTSTDKTDRFPKKAKKRLAKKSSKKRNLQKRTLKKKKPSEKKVF